MSQFIDHRSRQRSHPCRLSVERLEYRRMLTCELVAVEGDTNQDCYFDEADFRAGDAEQSV